MGFVLSAAATVLVLLLIFYLLNRQYGTRSGGIGAGPGAPVGRIESERVERDRPGLVDDDIRQMMDAQNALRRRRGAPEMSEADLRRAVAEDEENRIRGRGPFALE